MFSVRNGKAQAVPSIFGSSMPNRDNIMTQIIDKVVKVTPQNPPIPLPQKKDAVNPKGYR